ncbi:MAG: DUF116 domain-containing protein [Candidatus Auribacterota bacterium]|nr:DUF116 domain-containing protein [Candidatus Auribacterota bacterium]
MIKNLLIGVNNFFVKLRKYDFSPGEVLILCPKCLQSRDCNRNILGDHPKCEMCGKCDVGRLLKLAKKEKVNIAFVQGGRLAVKTARSSKFKAIIAIACNYELTAGLMKVPLKPVIAVKNILSNGPCVETGVNIDEVINGIRIFTSSEKSCI